MQVRATSADEGNRLLRIVRRSSGSVVTWRRAQIVLLSAQGMDAMKIADVTFTSADRVGDVLHNFNADGFDSLRPKYAGGRPPSSIWRSGLRSTRSRWARRRSRADVLDLESVKAGRLPGRCGGGRGHLPRGTARAAREQGVSFQAVKTWKTSIDPDYEAEKNRVLELHAIADGKAEPGLDDPTVVICMDEFGALNLQPHPGRHWAPIAPGRGDVTGRLPTTARTGSVTCWPATTSRPTGSTGTSSSARTRTRRESALLRTTGLKTATTFN